MRALVAAASVLALLAGAAHAQYRDRYEPYPDRYDPYSQRYQPVPERYDPYRDRYEPYRGPYEPRPPEMSLREEARELMQCAGYFAYIRLNMDFRGSWLDERLDAMEERFTRASDRISNADPRRARWFDQGSREAEADMQRYRYESLRDRVREKMHECRRLVRDR